MRSLLHRGIVFLFQLLMLVTPFIMSMQTSEMFEFPKMMVIYILTLTITVATIIHHLAYGLPFRWDRSLTLYLLFLGSQVIATVFSIDLQTSIFGYYGRFNGGILSTFMYGALLWSAWQMLDRQDVMRVIISSLVACVVVVVWGMPARFFGFDSSCVLFRHEWSIDCWTNEFRPHERMFSTLGQPNWLGAYISVHVLLIWRFVIGNSHKYLYRFTWVLVGVLLLTGLVMTGSRSAQLGLASAVTFVVAYQLQQKMSKQLSLLFGVFGVVILIIGSLWYTRSIRSASRDAVTHSGTIRLIVWEGAMKLVPKSPLVGMGPETFAYVYPLTRPVRHNDTSERDFIYNKAHNELLNILVTTGVLGLGSYLLYHGYVLWRLLKLKEVWAGAVMISLMVSNFFGFSTSTTQLALYLLVLLPLVARSESLVQKSSVVLSTRYIGIIVACLVWLSGFMYFRQYILADIAYNKATTLYQSDESYTAMTYFLEAMTKRREHVYINKFSLATAQSAYLLFSLSSESDDPSLQVPDTDIARLVGLAQRLQDEALSMSPANPYYWKDRVKLYALLMGSTADPVKIEAYRSKAHQALARFVSLAPTDLDRIPLAELVQ